MFKELSPLLRHRAVLLTITMSDGDDIRVNVVPKKLKNDENNALTTPLTIVDTAERLDEQLGATLVEFVGSHLQLKNTLQQAKADMDAAAKAAQAEVREKQKNGKKPTTPSSNSPKPAQQPTKPAEPVTPPAPKTASLFDMPLSASATTSTNTPASAPTSAVSQVAAVVEERDESEEDEILCEIGDEESEAEGTLDEAA